MRRQGGMSVNLGLGDLDFPCAAQLVDLFHAFNISGIVLADDNSKNPAAESGRPNRMT
jgi:hypothetical protein